MNAKKFRILHNSLLRWYQRHARRLPWRDTKDPYKIWVSEIMLQQTQVATVIPYYKKWMRRFPTVNSLARASEDTVLKHWAGLGYYRRARMLHEGARMLCTPLLSSPRKSGGRNKVGGQLPSDVPSLMKIPGIGRYTAGAIASIAFNRPEPILDGNVKRILSRIFAVKDPADTRDGEKKLWEIAKQLVTSLRAPKGGVAIPAKRLLSATRRGGPAVLFGGRFARNDRKKGPGTFGSPGDFNQAMMELGATVCLPRTPRCGECPVVRSCNAYARNRQSEYPLFFRKEQTEKKKTAALIIRKNDSVLVQKQPESARWGGLWMFPHWESEKAMMAEVRCKKSEVRKKLLVKHGFTKYRIELNVFEYNHSEKICHSEERPPKKRRRISALRHEGSGILRPPKTSRRAQDDVQTVGHWVSIGALKRFAFPSPHQKIADYVVGAGSPRPRATGAETAPVRIRP